MILVVGNAKGGVGKTTITANLSAALATGRKKYKVCAVDFDPQTNLTRTIIQKGVEVKTSMFSILSDERSSSLSIEDCIYPTVHPKLHLIPSVTELSSREIPMAKTFPKSALRFKEFARDYLIETYDIVICDVGPTINIMLYQALCAADAVLIIVDLGDDFSIANIETIYKTIESVKKQMNPNLKKVKLVKNRLNRSRAIDKIIEEELSEIFLDHDMFNTVIPVSADFGKVVRQRNASIFTYKPGSKGATAFRSLSKEVESEFL